MTAWAEPGTEAAMLTAKRALIAEQATRWRGEAPVLGVEEPETWHTTRLARRDGPLAPAFLCATDEDGIVALMDQCLKRLLPDWIGKVGRREKSPEGHKSWIFSK